MERTKKRVKHKVGFIGTGKIAGAFDSKGTQHQAQSHAAACFHNKNIILAAVCDPRKENLKKFLSRWRVHKHYLNVNKMLDEQILDVVAICAPSEAHSELIQQVVCHKNCPKFLFVEKPLCVDAQQLNKIQNLLKKTNVNLICNQKYRFHQGVRKVKDVLLAKKLGDILEARIIYYGGLLNNGVHLIDMTRYLLGLEPKVNNAYWADHGRKGDPCVNALLTAGTKSRIEIVLESFDEKYYQVFDMEIRLTKGRVRIMDFAKDIFIDEVVENHMGERELLTKKFLLRSAKTPLQNAYDAMVNSLEGKDGSLLDEFSFSQVQKTMQVLWAIQKKADLS